MSLRLFVFKRFNYISVYRSHSLQLVVWPSYKGDFSGVPAFLGYFSGVAAVFSIQMI